MRIKAFSYFAQDYLQSHLLKDCSVVIDGHNLYYPMYKNSNLPFIFGSDCDRFASYIRNQLEMFKRANLKCHILIKGGHDSKELFDVHFAMGTRLNGDDFQLGVWECGDKIINPLFIKDTFLQVLNEMGFEYSVIYRNDVVDECISLARKLSCPIISFNIQYCFSPVPYIPLEPGKQFDFDENDFMKCGMFTRENFLKAHKLSADKLILFILLTDSHIFHENTFIDFLQAAKIPLSFKRRYKVLLQWLHRKNIRQATTEIFSHISNSDRLKFSEQQIALHNKILTSTDAETMAILYFMDKSKVEIKEKDPLWFEKGVCLNYVSIIYINLYNFRTIKAFNLIENCESDKSILLSADIIKYAYDLITNFKGDEISIKARDGNEYKIILIHRHSVRKPDYNAVSSVFENGWNNIRSLRLFEHFLTETFQSFHFDPLERAPTDSRMLLIALVYFTRKKDVNVTSEVYSILLCYVMLSVVHKKGRQANNIGDATNPKPILDSTTDKDSVLAEDCDVAFSIMKEFFEISNYELYDIFNREILHPLVEFQCCLQEINHLNTLCGSPFDKTIYSETYNASFVYKIHYKTMTHLKDPKKFITDLLNPAATVLAFYNGLIEIYESILYEY